MQPATDVKRTGELDGHGAGSKAKAQPSDVNTASSQGETYPVAAILEAQESDLSNRSDFART